MKRPRRETASQDAEFEHALKALLENPCDENLDLINTVRANFVGSIETMEDIIAKLQALTWTIADPTSRDLKLIAGIISIGRRILRGTTSIITSYQPLWQQGVIVAETRKFRKVTEHLAKTLDYIEAVYKTGADRRDGNV